MKYRKNVYIKLFILTIYLTNVCYAQDSREVVSDTTTNHLNIEGASVNVKVMYELNLLTNSFKFKCEFSAEERSLRKSVSALTIDSVFFDSNKQIFNMNPFVGKGQKNIEISGNLAKSISRTENNVYCRIFVTIDQKPFSFKEKILLNNDSDQSVRLANEKRIKDSLELAKREELRKANEARKINEKNIFNVLKKSKPEFKNFEAEINQLKNTYSMLSSDYKRSISSEYDQFKNGSI
jgi:hypothetical protein